jgi:hypothetical protein
MLWLTECLNCGGFVYHLSDGRIKCSSCNKKTSINKINKILTLIQCFINDESALNLSKRLNISYVSVHQYYENFRILCAKVCEDEYQQKRELDCEYEEYFYLEHSKKIKKEAIFDAHNFLTFDYRGHIYTLLMPSLQQYKKQFIEDSVEDLFIDEFKKFKRDNRIIKVSKHFNNIVKFWDYIENATLKYKGIKSNSFIYFLKEFEFKYNHTKQEAIDILIKEYFKGVK